MTRRHGGQHEPAGDENRALRRRCGDVVAFAAVLVLLVLLVIAWPALAA